MLNKLPIIGWFFTAFASVSLSVPFWLIYTVFEIGETYFYFLPEVYQTIPFWNCVGLFIVISILKGTLTPKFVNVSNTQTMGETK